VSDFSAMRRSKLIYRGAWVGATLAFEVAVIYILLALMLLFLYFDSSLSNPTIAGNKILDNLFAFLAFPGLFYIVGMGLIGIIPAILLGAFNGGLIGFILCTVQKRVSSILAIFVGAAASVIMVLIVNFMFWLLFSSYRGGNFWQFFLYPFYLYYPRVESFLSFLVNNIVLSPDVYFLPSIIAIPLSSYVGWKINKFDALDNADQHSNIQLNNEEL
jgi:hypothetical protein